MVHRKIIEFGKTGRILLNLNPLLDKIKQLYKLPMDIDICNWLQVTQGAVSQWRGGTKFERCGNGERFEKVFAACAPETLSFIFGGNCKRPEMRRPFPHRSKTRTMFEKRWPRAAAYVYG